LKLWKLSGALILALKFGDEGCDIPSVRKMATRTVWAVVGVTVGRHWDAKGVGAETPAGNSLDGQARELEQVAETRRTEHGILLNLRNELLFKPDGSVLTEDAITQLTRIGEILAKHPEDRIRVEGHSDSRGPAADNEDLSKRRAAAVARVLSARGVAPEQMLVLGMGESQPVASNDTADGRSANRRVQIHISEPHAP
jgi:outer membrane protein OmpA-like peptidoglycan-associated protein